MWQKFVLFEGWKGYSFGRVHVVRTGFSGVSRWSAGEERSIVEGGSWPHPWSPCHGETGGAFNE